MSATETANDLAATWNDHLRWANGGGGDAYEIHGRLNAAIERAVRQLLTGDIDASAMAAIEGRGGHDQRGAAHGA